MDNLSKSVAESIFATDESKTAGADVKRLYETRSEFLRHRSVASSTIFDTVLSDLDNIFVLNVAALFTAIVIDFRDHVAKGKHNDFARFLINRAVQKGLREKGAIMPDFAVKMLKEVDEKLGQKFEAFLDEEQSQNLINLYNWRNAVAHCQSIQFTYDEHMVQILATISDTTKFLYENEHEITFRSLFT